MFSKSFFNGLKEKEGAAAEVPALQLARVLSDAVLGGPHVPPVAAAVAAGLICREAVSGSSLS